MNDPFDLLRDQLVRVATPRRRRRHTGFAFLAATLVLSGTAATAAVTLKNGDEPSAPLSGTFAPPEATPRAATTPAATATPRASATPPAAIATVGAGAAGPGGATATSGRSPGPAPAADPARRYETPPSGTGGLVAPAPTDYTVEVMPDLTAGQAGWCAGVTLRSGGDVVGGRGCGPAGRPGANLLAGGGLIGANGVAYAVVGPRVARVDFGDGRRIVPRTDAGVPAGWRAAVAQASEAAIVLLDAAGRRLSSQTHGDRQRLKVAKVSPTRPPDAPCAIRVRGLRPAAANLLTEFPGALHLAEPAFLSCATTVIYDGERRYRAAVLLDANHPGERAPELPATPRFLSARRVGNAWLVVFGGTSARERARVLDRLSVRRLP